MNAIKCKMHLDIKCNCIVSWKQSDSSGNTGQIDLSSRWSWKTKILGKLGNNI